MPVETPGYNNDNPKDTLNALSSNMKGMFEQLNTNVLKPVVDRANQIMLSISGGASGLLKPFIDMLNSFTAAFGGKPAEAAESSEQKSIMDAAKERLKDLNKLMSYRSPEGSKGCANFVSFALGLHKYENGQLIKNKDVLGNLNINTNWVPDLVKLFREKKYQEVTDPQAIHDAVQKGLPEGGIVIYANSYTAEDEDHIGIAVKNNDGKPVILNNSGPGVVRVRNDIASTTIPAKIRQRQEALKKNPKGGVPRDPVITKIFLPPETA